MQQFGSLLITLLVLSILLILGSGIFYSYHNYEMIQQGVPYIYFAGFGGIWMALLYIITFVFVVIQMSQRNYGFEREFLKLRESMFLVTFIVIIVGFLLSIKPLCTTVLHRLIMDKPYDICFDQLRTAPRSLSISYMLVRRDLGCSTLPPQTSSMNGHDLEVWTAEMNAKKQ